MTESFHSSFQKNNCANFIRQGEQEGKYFFRLDEQKWHSLVEQLKEDTLVFLGMWVDKEDINILFLEGGFRPLGVKITASVERYLAVSSVRPSAEVYERIILDLWGKEAMNAINLYPWLDRGVWNCTWPLSARPGPKNEQSDFKDFDQNAALFQNSEEIAIISPVSDRNLSPALWRFSIKGEKIIHAESFYGYTHRGIIANLHQKPLVKAFSLISRINALDSISHQSAFAHAIEDMAGFVPETGILRKRVILIELMRLNAHTLHLSLIFRALGIKVVAARYEYARELLMRWCLHYYGHRWLMDCIYPGLSCDPVIEESVYKLPKEIQDICFEAQHLSESIPGLFENLRDVGVLDMNNAIQYDISGYIGRASGRDYDIRRYMPEYRLEWLVPSNFKDGDVLARTQIRFQEICNSFNIIDQIFQHEVQEYHHPQEALSIENLTGEGIGVCEGVQGDIWYYVKAVNGIIEDIFIHDPAVKQAMILPKLMQNQLWSDQSVIRASFGILSTGADL